VAVGRVRWNQVGTAQLGVGRYVWMASDPKHWRSRGRKEMYWPGEACLAAAPQRGSMALKEVIGGAYRRPGFEVEEDWHPASVVVDGEHGGGLPMASEIGGPDGGDGAHAHCRAVLQRRAHGGGGVDANEDGAGSANRLVCR
jgi:hypothetical protein